MQNDLTAKPGQKEDEKKIKVLEIHQPLALANYLYELLDIEPKLSTDENGEADEVDYADEEDIPADLDVEEDLKKTPGLMDNKSFSTLWNLLKGFGELTLVVEPYYVDRSYRDIYYSYYAAKHFSYDRYCKRLFIFKGTLISRYDCDFPDLDVDTLRECCMGCIVIRPLKDGKIGRSLLNPKYFCGDGIEGKAYVRYANYDATVSGKRLSLKAFPYSMQDGEMTSCAETTIINLLEYFSKRYVEYRCLLPSEINRIAEKYGYDRKLPTKGLDYRTISKVLMEAGLKPQLYEADPIKESDPGKLRRLFHYYIESGIPVAAGMQVNKTTDRHSIIAIGHGATNKSNMMKIQYSIPSGEDDEIWLYDSANAVSDYIVMDDNMLPYSKYRWEPDKVDTLGDYKVEHLLAPLNRRMLLEATDAYDICTSIFASAEFGVKKFIKELGTKENPFVLRLFLASARGLKRFRVEHFGKDNAEARELYINTPFPRFIWVGEIYNPENYPNLCSGEMIIDATASAKAYSSAVILLHYPKNIFRRLPEETSGLHEIVLHRFEKWECFEGYRGNLHDSQEEDHQPCTKSHAAKPLSDGASPLYVTKESRGEAEEG